MARSTRREFLTLTAAGIGGAAVSSCALRPRLSSPVTPFRFAHISDTHIDPDQPKSPTFTIKVLHDLATLVRRPEFVIISGDLTNFGLVEELELYRSTVDASRDGIEVYHQPGNHDARWTNGAKKMFERVIGPTHQSFMANGVLFILMDSSMLLEQYGHLGKDQLDWMTNEIDAQPEGTPVILSMHHPPFVTEKIRGERYIDDEFDLLKRLDGKNIIAILCGHLHSAFDITVNGFALATVPAVIGSAMGRICDVTETELIVRQFKAGSPRLKEIWRVPLRRRPAISVALMTPREGGEVERPFTAIAAAPMGRETVAFLGSDEPLAMRIEGDRWARPLPGAAAGALRLTVRSGDEAANEYVYRAVHFTTEDSAIQWSHQTGGSVQSSPAVAEGKVVVGSDDTFVHCLRTRGGEPLWRFKTDGEVVSSPEIVDGVVYVASTDANVYALRLADGSEIWRTPTGDAIVASPRFVDGKILIGSGDFAMHCLDAATGRPLWRYATQQGLIKHRPAVADGVAYFGSWDCFFRAVDLETGGELWSRRMSKTMLYAPATSNPVIYRDLVIFVTHDYNVHALDRRTGAERWMLKQNETRKPSYSSGALLGDLVIYGSITGHALALDAATGRKVWNTRLSGTPDPLFDSSPRVVGRRVYMGSVHGNLWGLDAERGFVTFRQGLGGSQIFSTPAVEGDRLFVGSNSGQLWCVQIA